MIALSDSKIRFLHHPAEPEFSFLLLYPFFSKYPAFSQIFGVLVLIFRFIPYFCSHERGCIL